eukprot:TRINITY_DN15970_c1_g1_i1.p1 TRINITY_DN15970_c1_g1~~TRINITY_DN15970_c1_g1_i1.p1  ORF type:complete len:540 (+),score=227.42 TRINITY_DN15970_c1_g1_i1:92-1621(+)
MPGKKDKKKKQDAEPEPLKPEDQGYDKEELKVKIAAHEIRIRRYREENKRLAERAEQYMQENIASGEELKALMEKVTSRMEEKDESIRKMRLGIVEAENERKQAEERLERERDEERQGWAAQESKYKATIEELEGQLTSVQHFLEEKEQMELEIQTLKQQAEDRAARHKEELDHLREQHKEEREKLRVDMINKWRKTRLQVYKLTEDHLQTKTQQTIQENERLTQDLDVYARECREMMRQNDQLLGDRVQARRALELSDKSCQELMRKSQHQQRAIRSLIQQLREHEGKKQNDESREDAERQQRMQALNETVDKQYEMMLELKHELDDVRSQLREAESQLASARRDAVLQQGRLSEGRAFLLQCMDDAKRALAPNAASDVPAGRHLQGLSPGDRCSVIEYLCRRMEAFDSGFYPSAMPLSAVGAPDRSDSGGSGRLTLAARPPPAYQRGGSGSSGGGPHVPAPPSGSAWASHAQGGASAPPRRPHHAQAVPKDAATTPGDRLPQLAAPH